MEGRGAVWVISKGSLGSGGLGLVALVLMKSFSVPQQPPWPHPLKRKGLYPKGCIIFCLSHSPLKPNQLVSKSENGAEGKTRNKIKEPHSLFLPIPLRRGKLSLLPQEPLPYTLFSHLPAPLPSTGAAPWLPGMVAKSLHGRVGVGCAATNIAMVNQGTPGIGLGVGIMWM